ncbi:unnamed protein product [Knipowitschia caucasica]|uniref:Ig-like domain-containing protein n=1 Tax=Knipowitschia caucasica TaxID=637954 RepID=A0AAV2KK79_KNICA
MLLLQTLFIAGLVLKDSCFHVSGSDVSLNFGEHITLACSPSEKPDLLFWFRQNLGQKPTLVSSLYTFDQRGIFYSTFKDNPRFSLTPDFHLIISDLRVSDTATYYCASSQHYELKFANGTNVIVKGTGLNTGGSNDVEAAGLSQVLNCSVRTESCVGLRGIHWFKQFEESMMGVVYGVCGSDMENSNTCLYELPVQYVSSEQTGGAYCAAVTCGHQLLGNQTKVKVSPRPPQMASLWGAVAFTYALLFALTLLLCCLNQRNKTETCSGSTPYKTRTKTFHRDVLLYVATRGTESGASRRQKDDTWSECVYFSVQ